jgi:hypothetical protein
MSHAASLRPPYIPLRSLARWATGLLIATIVLAWIAVGVDLAHLRMLTEAAGGSRIPTDLRDAQVWTNAWLSGIQLALLAATATAFLLWLYQARANLRALEVRRPQFSRGWVVGGYLVPVLNLFRPYQVMAEIWKASAPENLDAFNWRSEPVPTLIRVWWVSFVGYGALAMMSELLELGAGVSIAKLQISTALALLADVTAALSACLACFVVTRLSDAQEEKWLRQQVEQAQAEAGAA